MSHDKPFERENRYIVLKVSDAKKHLSHVGWDDLRRVVQIIAAGRAAGGKAPLECVSVEKDWPEYELVWALLEARVRAQISISAVADSSHSRAVLELQKLAGLLKHEKPVEGSAANVLLALRQIEHGTGTRWKEELRTVEEYIRSGTSL